MHRNPPPPSKMPCVACSSAARSSSPLAPRWNAATATGRSRPTNVSSRSDSGSGCFGRAILPGAAPVPERFDGFRTGIAAIDDLLPDGVQWGPLSLWTGEATAGRTAALRALALHSCVAGARVLLQGKDGSTHIQGEHLSSSLELL
jgi:hypothetical protein